MKTTFPRGIKMRHFFLGWRRKVGVGVLVMALAFVGLWGRSHLFHESVFRYGPATIHEVSSEDGCLLWVCDRRAPDIPHKLTGSLWDWNSMDALNMTRSSPKRVRDPLVFRDNIHWQWKWGDFNFGTGTESSKRRQYEIDDQKSRNDPKEIRQFATMTQFLWGYFDERTVWVVPYWSIIMVLTLASGGLILIPARQATRASSTTSRNKLEVEGQAARLSKTT